MARADRSAAKPGIAREGWHGAWVLLRGPLRTLVAGQALGQGADGLVQIAFAQVVLFEIGKGATPARIAGVLAATLLPFSLVGPVAGVVIDRWDRRRVLVAVSIARAALATAAIAVVAARSEVLAYAGILVLLSSSRFILAAKGAALPRTVEREQLVTANAVSSVAGTAAAFAGAVAGSTFVGAVPEAGLVVAAACYAAAAAAFRRLPPVGGGETPVALLAGARRAWWDVVAGARVIARDRALRVPLTAVWLHRTLLGAAFILLVLVADTRYEMEASGYGLALAVTGVAAFAGTTVAPSVARRYRPWALLAPAFPTAGLAPVLGGYWPNLPVLVGGVAVVAIVFQMLKTFVDALVGGASADPVRGRVFAAYDVVYNVAFVLAGLALVPIWSAGRERALLWWLAAAFFLAGGAVAWWARTWPYTGRPARGRRPPHAWRGRLTACVLGALPVLAFPEPSLWWLAWIALVPLLAVVGSAPARREAGMRAWWGGTGFVLAMHHWLVPNLGPFAVPIAALLGSLWLPWGWIVWWVFVPRARPKLLAGALLVPAAWVTIEAARSWAALGGPWGLLGATQWNFRPSLAAAALGGVWLVSFLIVAVNVALAFLVARATPSRARVTALGVACVALALGPLWYAVQERGEAGRTLRVAAVQPGTAPTAARRFERASEISASLARDLGGPSIGLLVWGESSVGYDLSQRPDLLARLTDLSRAVGAPLLVNVDARRGAGGGIYKSSVLVIPRGVAGSYDKMRLVPFGEYVPLRFVLGWTARITEAAAQDRRRGEELVVLDADGLRVGVLVCFESAFPDMARHLANRRADVIVVQSATSTFQGSWAPEQHASLAAVRAVETGRPVVHATLTGQTAVFDRHGRRLGVLGTGQRDVLVVDVPLSTTRTLHDRFGSWVVAASLGIVGGAAVVTAIRRARRMPPTSRAPTPSASGDSPQAGATVSRSTPRPRRGV
jgi:apolipoprotein N-acyltransferase